MGQVISVELRKHEGARNDAGQVGLLGEVAHLRGQGHLIWRHAAGGPVETHRLTPLPYIWKAGLDVELG